MMKKTISKIAVIFAVMLCFAFTIKDKYYGGTASATAQVSFAGLTKADAYVLKQDGIKEGDRRVLSASTSCTSKDVTGAKEDLKIGIETQLKNYEKLVSSISYEINSCEH